MSDLRFAFRQFRRRPFVTAAMVAVLAIGIGVATSMFVLILSFTSAPLAAVDADDVVRIRGIDQRQGPGRAIGREFSFPEVREYAARQDVFREVGAWTSTDAVLDLNLGGNGAPDLHSGAVTFVTAAYFRTLGVQPVRGTGLPAMFADDGAPQTVAVISDAIWARFYDRSDAVLGQTLKVNGTAVTIAGVAPRRFVGARAGGSVMRVWLPLNARPLVQPSAPRLENEAATFGAIARLQPGVTADQANAVVATIATRFNTDAADRQGRPQALGTDVVPVLASNYFPPSGEPSSIAGPVLSMTMPLLVLLITCTSVSALLAGQALARRREIAVRLAMGAHRRRIVRQLLTETALLGMCGAGLALIVLWWVLAGVDAVLFGTGAVVALDWRAVAFTAILALVASLAFGLSPALHATRTTVSDVLKEGDTARGRTRLQATLVIAQIALTQPALLMMGTLLLELRSDLREQAPLPAAADRLVEVGFNTNPRYGPIDDARENAIARVRARIAALPGVAGAASIVSAGGSEPVASHPDDSAGTSPGALNDSVSVLPVTDGHFEAMGLPVMQGRAFGSGEHGSTGIAIVNHGLARQLWGDASAVGRRAQISLNEPSERTVTIVGVVEEEGEPRIYEPARGGVTSHLVVRTHGIADAVLPAIRAVALHEAPEVPITMTRTVASVAEADRRETMRGVIAAGTSGAVALLLAAVGLYAVVAVAVGQRRREIAVRAALGADGRAITMLFVRRGLSICLTGAVVGLGMSALVLKLLSEGQMFGQSVAPGLGVPVVAIVTAFVIAVALVASWIPARRAGTIDALAVLRSE